MPVASTTRLLFMGESSDLPMPILTFGISQKRERRDPVALALIEPDERGKWLLASVPVESLYVTRGKAGHLYRLPARAFQQPHGCWALLPAAEIEDHLSADPYLSAYVFVTAEQVVTAFSEARLPSILLEWVRSTAADRHLPYLPPTSWTTEERRLLTTASLRKDPHFFLPPR